MRKTDGAFSLDDEMQLRTAVMVLTGYDQDLNGAVNFEAIRSESLPLARNDVSATDCGNVIRVSLKTALRFIAGLQQREERAFSNSKRDPADKALEAKTDGFFAAVNSADEYVGDVLDDASKSCSRWSAIRCALEWMKAKERGEDLPETESNHWNANGV